MLVTNETAVLKDIQNGTPGRSRLHRQRGLAELDRHQDDDAHQVKPMTLVA